MDTWARAFRRLFSDYGMALVLLLLVVYYAWATWTTHYPTGAEAARQIVAQAQSLSRPGRVLIVAQPGAEAADFVEIVASHLKQSGFADIQIVQGEPPDVRARLDAISAQGVKIGVIAATSQAARWRVLESVADVPVITAAPYNWPRFLTNSNLDAIGDRVVVIAIIAIGMTMVILTGGIDLSVGSLIALSAVVAARLIRDVAGGAAASATAMLFCCLAAIALCALIGLFNGVMITWLALPPFIVTLAVFLIGRGLALMTTQGQQVYQIPPSIDWLGRGRAFFGLANAILLASILYALAQLVMSRTVLGRYIYAVGGNTQAARYSGVPVSAVIITCYIVSGAMAGLGGIIEMSRLQSSSPTYGLMQELYVIAACVVGGASLSGGRGKILGSLIGALIIAVIENGMNITGVGAYPQMVVLGSVILGAVLLDQLRRKRLWRT